jgi:hypothetical protein
LGDNSPNGIETTPMRMPQLFATSTMSAACLGPDVPYAAEPDGDSVINVLGPRTLANVTWDAVDGWFGPGDGSVRSGSRSRSL